jgi:hypothetical protein
MLTDLPHPHFGGRTVIFSSYFKNVLADYRYGAPNYGKTPDPAHHKSQALWIRDPTPVQGFQCTVVLSIYMCVLLKELKILTFKGFLCLYDCKITLSEGEKYHAIFSTYAHGMQYCV